MGKLEKSVSRDVKTALDTLERVGAVLWWERLNSGKVRTDHGGWLQLCRPNTPDFVAILPVADGIMIYFIETKSDSGRQTEGQKAFQKQVESWGGVYEVVRDVAQVKITVERITQHYENQIKNISLDS